MVFFCISVFCIFEFFSMSLSVPWFVLLFLSIYVLLKTLWVVESPCAVLGVPVPDKTLVVRAFRTMSLCTHPDRVKPRPAFSAIGWERKKSEEEIGEGMLGFLSYSVKRFAESVDFGLNFAAEFVFDTMELLIGRSSSKQRAKTAGVLFTKVSAAKDALIERSKIKGATCETGLDVEWHILNLFGEFFRSMSAAGFFTGVKEACLSLLSFEAGVLETLVIIFLISATMAGLFKFGGYLIQLGPVGIVFAILNTLFIAPVPTFLCLFITPFLRWDVFIRNELLPFIFTAEEQLPVFSSSTDLPSAGNSNSNVSDLGCDSSASSAVSKNPAIISKAKVDAFNADSVAKTQKIIADLKNRKKKRSKEEIEKEKKDALLGEDKKFASKEIADQNPATLAEAVTVMPSDLLEVIRMKSVNSIRARNIAAAAIKYDFLLSVTKNVIPVVCLVLTGQVFNGVLSSLIISHVFKNWIPDLSPSFLHMLAMLFGVLHTILGVNAAHAASNGMLNLQWTLSFKDVLVIANLMQLGATFGAAAGLGNEIPFTASFAAGLATRMLIIDLYSNISTGSIIENFLRSLNVSFSTLDDAAVRASPGIGDCGGGVFRMFLGDGIAANTFAVLFKCYLLLIPTLYVFHCAFRAYRAIRAPEDNKSKYFTALRYSLLFLAGLIQCILLLSYRFNAVNGSMANFWIAVLLGTVFESLLSTYDIRGTMRQLIGWLLFVLM